MAGWLGQTLGELQRGLEICGKVWETLAQNPDFADKVAKLPATIVGLLAGGDLTLDQRLCDDVKKRLHLMWNRANEG